MYSGFIQTVLQSKKIAFFGGAGVSTASGIPDFRGAAGLFTEGGEIPPETVLSAPFFARYPKAFYAFYKSKMLYPDAKPNATHYALARLEQMGLLTGVVTQNIDGLHQAAGSKRVSELHGSVHRNTCTVCRHEVSLQDVLRGEGVPLCPMCGGVVKPEVVLYGEQLPEDAIRDATEYIGEAELLIVAGTSLNVYPAAGFVSDYRGKIIVLNKTATSADARASLVLRGDMTDAFSALLDALR
ncbi:MAG: NAD-dependent protein deacylase [Clostridia bacterium]|nr:NAD-dependent protein deacylase [Clostridia bacterium]